MRLKGFIILGVCASVGFSSAAFAANPVGLAPRSQNAAARADVIDVLAKADQRELAKLLKKKALTPQEQSRLKALQKLEAQEKKEAEKKAKEAKLKAEKAEKEKKAAAAKAEREKKLATEKAEREKKLAAQKAEKEKLAAAKAKADKEKKEAAAKLAAEKKLAAQKAADERKAAAAKAAEERKLAKAKAEEERRLAAEAKIKAAEDMRQARIRAEEQRRLAVAQAAENARQAELAKLAAAEIVTTGNNGELRSEGKDAPKPTGLAALFGSSKSSLSMRPETKALDAALAIKNQKKKPFQVDAMYQPQVVEFSGYPKGSIVVDTASHFLYLVESSTKARRYGIAVGKEGLQYKGMVKVGDKQEWPRWIPTKEMQQRDPKKYGQYSEGMPGGGENPLGARAIYLYENGKDTHLRIHGTIAPESIGTDSSNGCFRMVNEHVMDLYRRVQVGTEVYVL